MSLHIDEWSKAYKLRLRLTATTGRLKVAIYVCFWALKLKQWISALGRKATTNQWL